MLRPNPSERNASGGSTEHRESTTCLGKEIESVDVERVVLFNRPRRLITRRVPKPTTYANSASSIPNRPHTKQTRHEAETDLDYRKRGGITNRRLHLGTCPMVMNRPRTLIARRLSRPTPYKENASSRSTERVRFTTRRNAQPTTAFCSESLCTTDRRLTQRAVNPNRIRGHATASPEKTDDLFLQRAEVTDRQRQRLARQDNPPTACVFERDAESHRPHMSESCRKFRLNPSISSAS